MIFVDCSSYGPGTGIKPKPVEEHRLNYGRLWPGKNFRADCSCGWFCAGDREAVISAVQEHEKLIP